jgi:hypothetical protein
MAELTDQKIAEIKPRKAVREVRDGSIAGLYLCVQVSGPKSWTLRYWNAEGRSRKLTLGSYPEISLAAARQQATEALALVKAGTDPADAKIIAKAVGVGHQPPQKLTAEDTIEEVARQYLALHIRGLRPRSQVAAEHYLGKILAAFPGRRLSKSSAPKCGANSSRHLSRKATALPPIACSPR